MRMNFSKAAPFLALLLLVYAPLWSSKEIPQLTVTGQSILKRPADEAVLTLGVSSDADTAKEALEDNSSKMKDIIDVLKAAGLKAGEYQTGQFSLYPLYTSRPPNAPDDWTPKIRGYRVDNRLIIRSQQLDMVGSWIDTAVQKGANAIDSISFGLSDFRGYRDEAIREAAAFAKQDAGVLAQSLGVRLGKVLSVSIDQAHYQPLMKTAESFMAMRSYAPGGGAPPIESGDVDVQARATVVYELLQ